LQTLLELYDSLDRLGDREAVLATNGYRTRRRTYRELADNARSFARRLQQAGAKNGDRVLIWAENRPEWVELFWGCILSGAAAVPVDFRSSPDLVRRIVAETSPVLCFHGDESDPGALPSDRRASLGDPLPAPAESRADVSPDDIVEILYTSGSTAEPKGVVHRHRNICANLTPLAAEIDRYRPYAAPFQPIRTLDLLPLSHMFGQTLGIFVPPMLGGSACFLSDLNPTVVWSTLRRERISVLASVPGVLESLRRIVEKKLDSPPQSPRRKGLLAIPETWLRHRKIHAATGYKFWAFVVGGASLDPDLESFWRRLGYAVIQGYGLTEASPVVAVNNPFASVQGSIGKPLGDQEIRLAPDGEILVRGANISSEYYGHTSDSSTRFDQGWLHTGDLGAFDDQGRLYYRGRKRDLIVRPDGMNVYPLDVEAALGEQPGVEESVVLGIGSAVHAALVLAGDAPPPQQVIAQANQRLEPHQRIQQWSVWSADDLPRTSATQKVRRGELARLIEQRAGRVPERKSPVEELLGRDLPAAGAQARLDEDLGLSSLERVELLGKVEERLGEPVDEDRFAAVSTVAELESLLEAPAAAPAAKRLPRAVVEPRWTRRLPLRAFRRVFFSLFAAPVQRRWMPLDVSGLEHLRGLRGPAIFAANHSSHLDTVMVYAALPAALRRRLAPAMSQDFFSALFNKDAPLRSRLQEALGYALALALFNAYPLPRRLSGARRALHYSGELIDAGYSILIFPEGTRSETGELLPFQPGVGLMARRLGVPVVPVRIEGLWELFPADASWPKSGRVRLAFGEPIIPRPNETYESIASRAETAVRALGSH
jgi:long-chain acyl-CoA synthetase